MIEINMKFDFHAFIRKTNMALYALIAYCVAFIAFTLGAYFLTKNNIVVICVLFLIVVLMAKFLAGIPFYGIGICALLIFISGFFVKEPLLTLFSTLLFLGAFGIIHMIQLHGGIITK